MVMMLKKMFFILLPWLILTGCATTGTGEFTRLSTDIAGDGLAIPPVQGIGATEAGQELLGRLDLSNFRKRYGSVQFIARDELEELEISELTPPLSRRRLDLLRDSIDSDFMLIVYVDRFAEEEFTTEGTRTLYHYRDRREVKDLEDFDANGDTPPVYTRYRDGRVMVRERIYDAEEVPFDRPRVRSVISVSAYLYDLRAGDLVWSGNRVERASGDIDRISAVELSQTVQARVARRLSDAFAP